MPIAAIIPLYNGARFIRTALDSVLAQTRKADEIIVVDDGSSDSGAAIVKAMQHAHPEIVLLSKSNGGQGSARNTGVAHARSDLIAFLDQDDAWYPHHLAELEKPFLAPPPLPLAYVYSDLDQIDINGRMVCHRYLGTLPPREHPKRTLANCLSQDMMILPGASLIDKNVFQKIGGFDERLRGYEDDDLFLRIFCAGYRGIYVRQPLSKWRIHTASASYSVGMARSRLIYFEKLAAEFPDEPKLHRFYIRNAVVPRFFPLVVRDLARGAMYRNPAWRTVSRRFILRLFPSLSQRQRLIALTAAAFFSLPFAGVLLSVAPQRALRRFYRITL